MTLLMYINLHTKVTFSKKKIGIFCNNIITFSSRAHLMKKVNISPKISHVLHNIDIFAPKLILTENTCHFASKFAWHYFITLLRNSVICPKTDAFCIKCYFLLKQNNATKNWLFSKTENTTLRIFNIVFFYQNLTLC